MVDIARWKGDTVPDNILVQHPNEDPYDVTGCTFAFIVRTKPKSGDPATVFQIAGVITDAVGGKVGFSPSTEQAATATGKYAYVITMTNPGGLIQTIASGEYTMRTR